MPTKADAEKAARPAIFLPKKAWTELGDSVTNALRQHFSVEDASSVAAETVALAKKVAAELTDLVHSSDTDCSYYAFAFEGGRHRQRRGFLFLAWHPAK